MNSDNKNWILGVLIIIAAFFVLFVPSYGWKIRKFLSLAPKEDIPSLTAENVKLKTELAKLENVRNEIPNKPANYLRVVVLSAYPTNFKNELLVDSGKSAGIQEGKAVVINGILIGKIYKVFDDTSQVQTIFDGKFQSAVRIGVLGYNALLRGGAQPKLALISKNAKVVSGDAIYSASANFPYALPIGTIGEIGAASDNLFQEATINLPYDINAINYVLVDKNAK